MGAQPSNPGFFRRRARSRLRILVLLDPITVRADDQNFERIGDPATASMEHHIIAGLRSLNHHVEVLAFHRDTEQAFEQIREAKADVVFNLVESIGGDRRKSSYIPAMLELLGIPYTGGSTVSALMSLDKALSKHVLSNQGIPVPDFAIWPVGASKPSRELRFPAIVKPRFGGGSEGVSLSSVVRTRQQMGARAKYIHRTYRQPAICEEYIAGREFSVGVVGNAKPLFVLPTRETIFACAAEGGPAIATDRVKSSKAYRERWKISYEKANIPPELERATAALAHEAYLHLEMKGYARVDMRLHPERGPVFLEMNANPDLSPRVFGVMASWVGITYEQLLTGIVELALQR